MASTKDNIAERDNREDSVAAARSSSENISEEEGSAAIQFENGFTPKVMIGTLFVCLVMLPGAIYLGLVAGQNLGGAAQWVTIVLFSEIARRSFIPLKRQEIYCLYYMAAALTVTGWSALPGISGGPFGSLIGLQYLMQAPPMQAVAHTLPHWVAPQAGSTAYLHRSFLDQGWWVPFFFSAGTLILINVIFDRLQWIGLGYLLFRITSDVERLPFPMAPVAASGALALAEAGSKEDSWRWQIFSTGTIVGLIFGFFYLAIPIFTGVVFTKPIELLPIPFFDVTPNIEHMAPTALLGYNPDLGKVLWGMVIPFSTAFGMFVSSVLAQTFMNPWLYHHGMITHWVPGSPAIPTWISANVDFWMSFGIGLQVMVAAIGICAVAWISYQSRAKIDTARRGAAVRTVPAGRGDFPIWGAVTAWICAMAGYILLDHKLLPTFPIAILLFYGVIWTPLNSYVTARIIGLTGQQFGDVSFVNQFMVIGSHYPRSDVWFAPLPLNNYGRFAQTFRELELTGTKFSSVVKLEFFMAPLILGFSFIYWGFLWHTNDIPSAQFPYAQKFWPQFAVTQSIWSQINAPGGAAWAKHILRPNLIGVGAAFAGGLYLVTYVCKWPMLFYYGFLGGVTQYPHDMIPQFVGALLGRYYFGRVLGRERWQLYAPVILAGFSCGTGLMGMSAIALALISKTVSYLPF